MTRRFILTTLSTVLPLLLLSCVTVQEKDPSAVNITQLIKEGKIEEAKQCFTSKYDINSVDEDGNTALHLAAKLNDSSLALFLLCNGADPDLKNFQSQTPLHVAVESGSKEAASTLVNFGCNIFARNEEGVTAMDAALSADDAYYDIFITTKTGELRDAEKAKTIVHYFVETGNAKAVQQCARKGIPLSVKDNEGLSPLAYAYRNFSSGKAVEIAAILITNGAEHVKSEYDYFETAVANRNVDYRFDDGQTPLHLASIAGHEAVAKYFIANNALTNIQDSTGASPLHEAVRYGRVELAKLLLNSGADINAKDNLGKTPVLLIIPEEKRSELYTLLASYKANLGVKDMYGDTVLHTATMTSVPVSILDTLISGGAEINARNKDGVTPLALAIENNEEEHIKFYSENGADINSKDTNGTTPLILALRDKDPSDKILRSIVNRQNITSVDSEGNTPLMNAIQNNATLTKIQYIISLTDDVNTRNADGNTALYLTVLKNRQKVGELLLSKNADIFATNNRSKSPLSLALYDGGSVIDWLITSKTIVATDGSGNTALHFAAEWGLKDAVSALILKGAKTEAKNANGETPLFSAAKNDEPEVIQVLVNNGCRVNARDNLGSTPLHMAVRWRNPKAVARLVNLGAEIDAQNVSGHTPLAEAAIVGKYDIANLLLLKGANPNASNTNGKTVLMDAVRAKNVSVISLLLANNANPQIQDLTGRNCYHEAALTADPEIIAIIRKAGGNPLTRDKNGVTPLSMVLGKDEVIIREVLGNDTTISDSDGNTPIHFLVKANRGSGLLQTLISAGYPFDTRNADGHTPLYAAVEKDRKDAARILLENGANPFIAADSKGNNAVTLALKKNNKDILNDIIKYAGNSADIQGNTILHYAARTSDAATISHLLSYGLDVNVRNIYDETPYSTAVRWHKDEAAKLLKAATNAE